MADTMNEVQCVGNRRLRISRDAEGNVFMVIVYRGQTELAHLIIPPAEGRKLSRLVNKALKKDGT